MPDIPMHLLPTDPVRACSTITGTRRLRLLILGLLAFRVLTCVAQSRLEIAQPVGGTVVLSWAVTTPPDVLETAESIGPGSAWQAVSETPALANGRFLMNLNPAATPRYFRLRRDTIVFTTVAQTSPAEGETGVSVTRESVFRFSTPLASDLILASDEVSAEARGRRLLTRAELASDRQSITLFYLENLPGGTRVQAFLDGSKLRDATHKAIDGDADGTEGGIFSLSFETMPLLAATNTAVIGKVYASVPNPDGSNRPLENVTITVDGAEESQRTVTDRTGSFTLSPAPAGRFFVHVDGRTAIGSRWPGGAYYPFVGKAWETIPGKTNNLASGTGEIFLPLIDAEALQPVSATAETRVTFAPSILASNPALAGVEIRVPANALFADSGVRGGKIGMAPVPPDRLPEPLPPGLEFPIVITVQTDGPQNFDGPIPVRFPNLPDPVTGITATPGSKTLLWSFNHDTGRWEPQGTMTITADGRFAETDPGVGMRQPGWHGVQRGKRGHGPQHYYRKKGNPPDDSNNPPDDDDECRGDDCECVQEITCTTPKEGRNYALCALSCLGDTVDRLFGDAKTDQSPIEAGLTCIGGPEKCRARPDDILTQAQKDCIDACRFPEPDVKTYVVPCEGFINPCTAPALHGLPRPSAVDAGTPVTDRLAEQKFFWEAQVDLMVRFAGTPRITEISFEELDLMHAFYDAYGNATQAASPNGIHLSAAERTTLVNLPRPSVFSVTEWTAMIDRFDALEGNPLPPDVLAAQKRVEDAVTLLKTRGWKNRLDGLSHGLVRLSRALAPGVGGEAFPRRAHYYYLKDHRTGFVQRGRLNQNCQFENLIIAPNGYFTVAYLDPVTLRIGAAFFTDKTETGAPSAPPADFFASQTASTEIYIPSAPLTDLPETTTDSDGDGLPDVSELIVGTNPNSADTDGDGIKDAAELQNGTNPNDGTPALTGVIATTGTPGSALGVYTQDGFAFIADDAAGLSVLRLNGANAPTLVANLPLGAPATAIAGNSTTAALATPSSVKLVDVSNPLQPKLRTTVDLDAEVNALSFYGDELAVATAKAFVILDARTGSIRQSFTEFGINLQDVLIDGNRLFGLSTLDLLAFTKVDDAWQFVSSIRAIDVGQSITPGRKLLAIGDLVHVGLTRGPLTGMRSFDVSNLSALTEVTPTRTRSPQFMDLAATGSKLVSVVTTTGALGSETVSLYDPSNISSPPKLLTAYRTPGVPQQTVVEGGLIVVADADAGVSLINFLQPDRGTNAPTVQVRLDTPNATGQAQFGGTVIVAVNATDDVGVRRVALEVDGQEVSASGTAALRFRITLPKRDSGRTSLTLRARATDLAGHVGVSPIVTVNLVDDAQVPRITHLVPSQHSVYLPICSPEVSVQFDEPVTTPITADTLKVVRAGADQALGTADDEPLAGAVTYDTADRRITFTINGALGTGPYQAILAPGIGDAAGNRRASAITWNFQATPLAKVVAFPPADQFAFGVPLTSFVIGLDLPLCAAAQDTIQWRFSEDASNFGPQRDLNPVQVSPSADGRLFTLRPPTPLGSGSYRLEISGAGLQTRTVLFKYRNTPNEVSNVGNNQIAVWKFNPGLVPGDVGIVNFPSQSVTIQFPGYAIRSFHAISAVAFTGSQISVNEPIVCERELEFFDARFLGGVTHARGPLMLTQGATLSSHVLNAYGGGYLAGNLKFGNADGAFINHPGSLMLVTNTFSDANTTAGTGSIINRGTFRGVGTTNFNFPLSLQSARLRNDGLIEVTQGMWSIVNLENQGTLDTAPNTRFVFAQRLRAGPTSRINASGDIIFGLYNPISRQVVRAADADLQGELNCTGTMSVDGGTVTLHRAFTYAGPSLEVQHGATLEMTAPSQLSSAFLSSGTLRFTSDGSIRSLNIGDFGAISSATRVTITSDATIDYGFTAQGRGIIEFQGNTITTNGAQAGGLSFEDAVIRNTGTWLWSSASPAASAMELRRVSGRWGQGFFENRGVFEQTKTRPITLKVPFRNYGRAVWAQAPIEFDGRKSLTSESQGRLEPQIGSELVLNSTTLTYNEAGPMTLAAGVLRGDGILRTIGTSNNVGYAVVNGGEIRLDGTSGITINAAGGFQQTTTGFLTILLSPNGNPALSLVGSKPHQIDGTLRIQKTEGFDPAIGQTFVLLTHNTDTRSGAFARLELPDLGPTKKLEIRYEPAAVRAEVVAR
ncbi:MAG: Ig-like domain-containing protein [Verrucomicrobiales bacterium]|nr:Ig-like domain-containing protein [Verrucomicrobiales bacterium]